jgi:uncharacterized protein
MSGDGDSGKPVHPVRLRKRRPCPVCGQLSAQKYHPFCSPRCADVDLHRWLGGKYAIPAVEPPDFDDMNGEAPPAPRDERDD